MIIETGNIVRYRNREYTVGEVWEPKGRVELIPKNPKHKTINMFILIDVKK